MEHTRGDPKIPEIVKIIYLKYSYKNKTSVAFKVLHPVTGCCDPSAAPPALPKICNGNVVKNRQQSQQNASPLAKNNLAPCGFFSFPGMNRDLKGSLTAFALKISDTVPSRGSGAGIATSSHRRQCFEGDKSFKPARLF